MRDAPAAGLEVLIETKGVERVGRKKPRDRPLAPKPSVLSQVDPGADDGIRTRDPHLGKVVLYR